MRSWIVLAFTLLITVSAYGGGHKHGLPGKPQPSATPTATTTPSAPRSQAATPSPTGSPAPSPAPSVSETPIDDSASPTPSATPKIHAVIDPTNFDSFRASIESHNVDSIEDLLQSLPAAYRSNFALMYESHSLQHSSPLYPRTILYGADGQLILAFASDPDFNYTSLEVAHYQPDQKAFEFYEVTFPGGVFSDRNPSACLDCHRTDLRPNWEAYNQWPGAYGGNDDRPDPDPTVEQSLQDFIKSVPDHPRFSQLPGLVEGYTVGKNGRYAIKRNAMLSLYTSRWNYERMVRILQADPNYSADRYAIAGLLQCPGPVSDFFPDTLKSAVPATSAPLQLSDLQFLFPNLDFADDLSTGFLDDAPIKGFQTIGNATLEFTGKLIAADSSFQSLFKISSESFFGLTQSIASPGPSACDSLKRASISALSAQMINPGLFLPPGTPIVHHKRKYTN